MFKTVATNSSGLRRRKRNRDGHVGVRIKSRIFKKTDLRTLSQVIIKEW